MDTTVSTSAFIYQNDSLSNNSVMFLKNIRLWDTFSITTLRLTECTINNVNLFSGLLHTFDWLLPKDEAPSFKIVDTATNRVVNSRLVEAEWFCGYWIFNDINMEFKQTVNENLKQFPCLDFSVTKLNSWSDSSNGKEWDNTITKFSLRCWRWSSSEDVSLYQIYF